MGSREGCSQLMTWELICRWETCRAWQRGKIESPGPQAEACVAWTPKGIFKEVSWKGICIGGYGWVGKHSLLDTHTYKHKFIYVQQRIWQNIMFFSFLLLLHVCINYLPHGTESCSAGFQKWKWKLTTFITFIYKWKENCAMATLKNFPACHGRFHF